MYFYTRLLVVDLLCRFRVRLLVNIFTLDY